MAYCKHPQELTIQQGSEFDEIHEAGSVAPLSGVYRCAGCGRSVTSRNGTLLPGADHHRHDDAERVGWRLVVRSHWA